MNESHEIELHNDACSCDRCFDARFEAAIVERTWLAAADWLWRRASWHVPGSSARTVLEAAAADLRRGGWRK